MTARRMARSRPLQLLPRRWGTLCLSLIWIVGMVALASPVRSTTPRIGLASDVQPGPDSVLPFGATATLSAVTSYAPLNAPLVGIASALDRRGNWSVGSDGGVFTSGGARFFGSLGDTQLSAPVIGIAPTRDGNGYWLATADGGVSAFGDARLDGSAQAIRLNEPIVAIAATPVGNGYWLVAADGGVFTFGDARFEGTASGLGPDDPLAGIAPTPDGRGYWLATTNGEVLAFGDAHLWGSASDIRLNAPIVGIAATPDGRGYWLAAEDGGVFAFGDARYRGSAGGDPGAPVVGIAPAAGGEGYFLATGAPSQFASAVGAYAATRYDNITAAVFDIANGRTYSFRPGLVENTASTVKVDILSTLLSETQARGPLSPYLQSLAVPMIEDSLNSAASALWAQLGTGPIASFERAAGLVSTVPGPDGYWGATTTTATDRLALLRTVVFPNDLLTPASRAYVLYLMEHVTPEQDWGATGGVPNGVTVALKNGFQLIDDWQMNTTGWVDGDGRDYLIAVLTNGNEDEDYGIQTVNTISAIAWNSF
jgi:hypothetical protein